MFNPQTSGDRPFHLPIQCIWLKLNGSWPIEKAPTVSPSFRFQRIMGPMYTIWAWYVLFSVGITVGFQIGFLCSNLDDIAMTTENCCTTFMGTLNFIRLLHMRLKQDEFRQLIANFANNIWNFSIVKYAHIERRCQRNMNIFRVMTLLLYCLILMYCILPLVQLFQLTEANSPMDKPFPYKMIFPYNAFEGWNYLLTYLFTSYAGLCVVTTLFAEDSLFGFFVNYTCAQFEILHESINVLLLDAHLSVVSDKSNCNIYRDTVQREYNRRLKYIASRHNTLIQFSNDLENFFSPMMLVNFFISSILICMIGFQLVTGKGMFIGDYIKFLVFIASSLTQLFILCFNGDKLIQASTKTKHHLYTCNWEGGIHTTTLGDDSSKTVDVYLHPADRTFRRNLQFMLMCTDRPIKITAFKFSPVSLQSFSTILSTSMSYFTLLQSVYKKTNERI